jgi:predicted type IV restriction endonuclease
MSIVDELNAAGLPAIPGRRFGVRYGIAGIKIEYADVPARPADGVDAAVAAGASFYLASNGQCWVLADGRLESSQVLAIVAGVEGERNDAVAALEAVLSGAYVSAGPSPQKRKKASKKAAEKIEAPDTEVEVEVEVEGEG